VKSQLLFRVLSFPLSFSSKLAGFKFFSEFFSFFSRSFFLRLVVPPNRRSTDLPDQFPFYIQRLNKLSLLFVLEVFFFFASLQNPPLRIIPNADRRLLPPSLKLSHVGILSRLNGHPSTPYRLPCFHPSPCSARAVLDDRISRWYFILDLLSPKSRFFFSLKYVVVPLHVFYS